MSKEQNNQELERRIEQLLTPRFAPAPDEIELPEIKIPTNPSKRNIWTNIIRIGSVAAALIIGLFIIVGPSNKVEAKTPMEIVSDALQEFQQADTYRVKFTAKVVTARVDANDYYRVASDGKELNGTLTILKTNDENGGIMRIEWESGVTQIYDGNRYYEWEGTTQTDDKHCPFQTLKVIMLADLEFVKAEFRRDGLKINHDPNGDEIQVIKDSPDYALVGERMMGIFSKKSGKLVGGGYFEKHENEWKPIIKLTKVEYGFPLTVEQIMAKPKR